jgi:CoA:oxalate CoA-transferase
MLDGIRVIDLTSHLAGPYCSWLLGRLGADVIKVERPGGDPAREIGPHVGGESLYFASLNRNKRSIVLDLKSPADHETFQRLIRRADVLVENLRPGVLSRLGFDDSALAALNPGLVHASISGFGQDGPLAARPAFDVIAQGMGGLMSVTGPEGGDPVRAGASIGDIAAALFATIDILAALLARERGADARPVDVAMLDCQLALLENAVARTLNAGEIPRPLGTRHPSVAPFQAFATADGMIVIAADGEAAWARLCQLPGFEGLADDARFASGAGRIANHGELEGRLNAIFLTRPRAAWLADLEAADIPCGPVNNMAEALAQPQVAARRMVSEVAREDGTTLRFAAAPIGDRTATPERPAPALGEHSAEIIAELGDE